MYPACAPSKCDEQSMLPVCESTSHVSVSTCPATRRYSLVPSFPIMRVTGVAGGKEALGHRLEGFEVVLDDAPCNLAVKVEALVRERFLMPRICVQGMSG